MQAIQIMQSWENEGGEDTTGLDWYSAAESVPRFCEALTVQLCELDECAFYLDTGARVALDECSREWRYDGDWLDVVYNMNPSARNQLLDVLVAQGFFGLATVLVSV